MDGKRIRLNRLFQGGNRAVVVAIDHGQTFGPTLGLENFTRTAEQLSEANGILLAPHMIRFSGNLFLCQSSPVCIARLNWNTIHCEPWNYKEARIVRLLSVKDAIRLGADIVLASLTLQTGDEAHDAQNAEVFARSVAEANEFGIPIIGEVFPSGNLRSNPDEFHDYIKKMCRIIAELGADAIKTFYTDDRFSDVIDGTPIPVFALGAEKMKKEVDALRLAQNAVNAGAMGVVFGRNVILAKHPAQFLRALKAVVQGHLTVAEAALKFNIEE